MSAQEPLPRDFEEQARRRFSQIANPEVTVEQYIEFETRQFQRQRQLEGDPSLKYQPGLPGMTPCGNGDFETDIATTAEWQGAYGSLQSTGSLLPPSPPHPFTNFTAGIYPGPINSANSHQTWGATGLDPKTLISTTAPGSSQHAVRIGNHVNGYGCELFVCGVEPECACACGPVRPGSYATEINIYNHNAEKVAIRKYVVPVVLAGAPAGREPRVVGRRAEDAIVLPPHSATMDDCCRLAELLLGAPAQGALPLTVGFLEIVSPVELSVTAVYTASSPNANSISIDVDQIVPKIVLV